MNLSSDKLCGSRVTRESVAGTWNVIFHITIGTYHQIRLNYYFLTYNAHCTLNTKNQNILQECEIRGRIVVDTPVLLYALREKATSRGHDCIFSGSARDHDVDGVVLLQNSSLRPRKYITAVRLGLGGRWKIDIRPSPVTVFRRTDYQQQLVISIGSRARKYHKYILGHSWWFRQ